MAALEMRILSELVRLGEMHAAIRAGLKEDHFKDPEGKAIFKHLMQHWYNRDTFRTLPSLASVQRMWPAFKLTAQEIRNPEKDPESGPLVALIKDLKMSTFDSDVRSMADYFHELVQVSPKEAVPLMMKYLTEISSLDRTSEKLGVRDVIECAVAHYDSAQAGTHMGIPWPWKCLTEDTLGKRPGNLIVFYARMKQMKTWVMLYCAMHDLLQNKCRVLLWSREMNKESMALRLASLMAKVDYQLFKRGKLPPKVYDRACTVMEDLMNEVESKRQLILLCGRDAPTEMDELKSIIHQYSPDVVYLDSFYHLETNRMKGISTRWNRIAILSEDTKALAMDEHIPIIAVHQANRSGEKTFGNTMADMADSDVLARESDLVIRILKRFGKELWEADYEVAKEQQKIEDAHNRAEEARKAKVTIHFKLPPKVEEEAKTVEEQERLEKEDPDEYEEPRMGTELALVCSGNREGVLEAFTIHAVPGYNFDFISSDYATADIEDWIKQDDSGGDKKPKSAPKSAFNKDSFRGFSKAPEKGAK